MTLKMFQVNLKKLDLGRNQISSAEGLENLVHLTQLSLEDNLLTSLNGLQMLTNLMELCTLHVETYYGYI